MGMTRDILPESETSSKRSNRAYVTNETRWLQNKSGVIEICSSNSSNVAQEDLENKKEAKETSFNYSFSLPIGSEGALDTYMD
jgi:hypothetical protein